MYLNPDLVVGIVVIPQYIRRVKLSNSRRKKYYIRGKKTLPLKYQNERYQYEKRRVGTVQEILVDTVTKLAVIANPKSHSTPHYQVINGQGIYNQTIVTHQRDVMMKAIKESFAPYMEELPLIDFPVRIYVELHDEYNNTNGGKWDLDNRFYMYQKAFQDCLTGNKDRDGKPTNKVVLEDDSVGHITMPPCPLFIPIESSENRQLVFFIVRETDPRIIENINYKKDETN